MKKILGLDLGTTSVGWAIVNVAEKSDEKSAILGCGSRVVPISTEEKDNFEKGKASSTNADRTIKRGMRRNLQRRKQRRDTLLSTLKKVGFINDSTQLSENGKGSTYETLRLRSKAATEEITLQEFARILLSINNKRGYKSSRKAISSEDGQLIDGMEIAKELQLSHLTPAEFSLNAIKAGKPARFDFYRSDLEAEFNRIWNVQKAYYPAILTEETKVRLSNQGRPGTSKLFLSQFNIFTADNKGKNRKSQSIEWRVEALSKQLKPEVLAYVLADVRGEITNSSGYLGEISDRSKELYFSGETIGQFLYRSIKEDLNFSCKNKVFYRQDYLDEFNRIWDTQSKYHPELTPSLKKTFSDTILFYQRPLKSQKKLVSFCEFESHPITVTINGKEKVKLTGSRVAPRSSLLFQEFKIWQVLNNLALINKATGEHQLLTQEERLILADELYLKPKLKQNEVLKLLNKNIRKYKLNHESVEGNTTVSRLFSKYLEIVNVSGHGEYELDKLKAKDAIDIIKKVFEVLGCNTDIISFDPSLPKNQYEQQPLFKIWHLLYSYEGDKSKTGNESLIQKLSDITGLGKEYASLLSTISFSDDYSSLSHKAICNILPYLKAGYRYDEACQMAGYNHSHSQTKEDLNKKVLIERLVNLPKGALRNPIVEKILNQMINVVNAVADHYGKPDEIHIELARELKQSAKEREKYNSDIQTNKNRNDAIAKILQSQFGLKSVKKADIVRYRLYEELKENGYKTLYSNQYISPSILFSKDIDIEHIIPQALYFNDSFANKTLEFKDINIEKGRMTANDYVKEKYGEENYEQYCLRIDDLTNRGAISESKRRFLLMPGKAIPEGLIERDLRNSQYIAKKSRELLEDYVKVVLPTTGSVTAKLREDWRLVDVMKEINLEKYTTAGRTHIEEDRDGRKIVKIEDWTKRDDHRHHAMDAITIAFTRQEHIDILNNLNAKSDKGSEYYGMYQNNTISLNGKRIFIPPMPLDELRAEFKKNIEATLVSIKAKNKVVTRNINHIKTAKGVIREVELTPRGELHKEQVYGKRKRYQTYVVPVGSKMNADVIASVASKKIRDALSARLKIFEGDSKKAFTGNNSLAKNPIYIDASHTATVPDKVRCVKFETFFSIRKEVAPELSVDKVLDNKARQRIKERIAEHNGNAREALSNLDLNPIWLDEKKTIPIKRVTIGENFDLTAIREKRDKNGNLILDNHGLPIPSDYVNLRNNHHIELFKDQMGQIHEIVVPMFDALQRINNGQPIIDKTFNKDNGWTFLFSLKINEMFVLPDAQSGFYPKDIDLMNPDNATIISPHLFRVQKISRNYYVFRHHQETSVSNEDKSLRGITWERIQNIQKMRDVIKVRIDHLGHIVAVGEYD